MQSLMFLKKWSRTLNLDQWSLRWDIYIYMYIKVWFYCHWHSLKMYCWLRNVCNTIQTFKHILLLAEIYWKSKDCVFHSPYLMETSICDLVISINSRKCVKECIVSNSCWLNVLATPIPRYIKFLFLSAKIDIY